MTLEDAKEMIKILVRASNNNKEDNPVNLFAQEVMSIIDRIDTGNSGLTYAPNVRDTYIDKCMSDKDMFRIHPEDGPFYGNDPKDCYGNGPKDCFGNPIPYCGIDKIDSGHPNFSNGITTCTCCETNSTGERHA